MNQDKFIEEVKKLNIEVTNDKLSKLNTYYEMLIEYNKVMNLTAITQKEDVYLKHFYDSLTISKIINLNEENNLCDIGTGAGFPGIVLKIFYPNLKVTLIDSLNKRINFLNDVIDKLELKNIEAIHSRIEDYAKDNREKFDIVTARAVAPLNILIELAIPLVKVNKYFIAMKGNLDREDNYLNALNKLNSSVENLIKFKLPIEESDRTLLSIKKNQKTSRIFPRKYSDIKKKIL